MKIKPNRPSKEQTELMKRLSELGYTCRVVYDFDSFSTIVEDYYNNRL